MKKFLIYIFSIVIILCLNQFITIAQTKIGLHLGGNLANANYSIKEAAVMYKPGFTGGLLLEKQIFSFLFFQTEFSFIQKGVRIEPMFDDDSRYLVPNSNELLTLNYFQIPLLLKLKIQMTPVNPYIFFGINIGYLLKTQGVKTGPKFDKTVSYKDSFDPLDGAYDFGIGAEYPLSRYADIFVNFRYSLGKANISSIDRFSYETRGLQLMAGIQYCISGCEPQPTEEEIEKQKRMTLSGELTKKPDKDRLLLKEFDLGKYDVPFFVTGYYRPNTSGNLDELVNLKRTTLKSANYIETFTKNSPKYKQYKTYAQTIDGIFKTICSTSSDEIFPNFIKSAKDRDTLEITVYGYADPRAMSGKYLEDESIIFIDKKNRQYTVNNGDALDNFKLSGMRSYNTGKYLDEMFMECGTDYKELKNDGKVKFRFISVGVADLDDEENLEVQRKIRIVISRKLGR